MGKMPQSEKKMEKSCDEIDLETSDEEFEDEKYDAISDLVQYKYLYSKSKELRKSGQFQVPGGMWSLLQGLGATLRLLAPAALVALLCGRDSPLIRWLHHCDRALRNALYPPSCQSASILQWLQSSLPGDSRTSSLDAVWADGAVLCDLVESVVPGSCSGHSEQIDLTHGQRLAEQYLGVTPIFSKAELSQKALSTYQECRLTHYLGCVQDAINGMTPPLSRAGSPLLNAQAYTLDYVARGMGLITASKNRKASFYIYPTAQQSLEPGDISIQIKGPDNCYGSVLIPVIYGKAHIIRNVLYNLGSKQNYLPLPLPIIHGSAYVGAYDNMNVKKKYFVPKIPNDIEMNILVKHDRVKVSYIPKNSGLHELSLISKSCHVIGSPFIVNVEVDAINRQESSDYTDEDISVDDILKPDRKIVFRIVDFVTEKMILTEDGRLEKISNEDADTLLKSRGSIEDLTNKYIELSNNSTYLPNPDIIEHKYLVENNSVKIVISPDEKQGFKMIVRQIIIMLQVCKELKRLCFVSEKSLIERKYSKDNIDGRQSLTSTPDVVHSTIIDTCPKEALSNLDKEMLEHREKAEDLRHKFMKKYSSFNVTADSDRVDESVAVSIDCEKDCVCNADITQTQIIKHEDTEDQYSSDLDSTHNHSDEATAIRTLPPGKSIEIIISSFDDDDDDTADTLIKEYTFPEVVLPILEEIPERPKTPVFKILQNADDDNSLPFLEEYGLDKLESEFLDSLDGYLDSFCPQIDNALNSNLSLEDDQTKNTLNANLDVDGDGDQLNNGRASPSINFHIGEPVTPTKLINASTSLEPDMDSIILASNLEEALNKYDLKVQKSLKDQDPYNSDDSTISPFTTVMRQIPFEKMTDSEILKMYEEPLSNKDNDEGQLKNADFSDLKNVQENRLHDFNVEKGGVNIVRRLVEAQNLSLQSQDSISTNAEDEERHLVLTANNSVDTWDSAYISIDEINSSPEINNNSPKSELSPKNKLFSIEENDQDDLNSIKIGKCISDLEILPDIGPAEREIWKVMTDNETRKEKALNTPKNYLDSTKIHNIFPRVINNMFYAPSITEGEILNEKLQNTNQNMKHFDSASIDDNVVLERFPNNRHDDYPEKLYNKIDTMTNKYTKGPVDYIQNKNVNLSMKKDTSASDFTADVKQSNKKIEYINTEQDYSMDQMISTIQTLDAERTDDHRKVFENQDNKQEYMNTKPVVSKLISEKRDYWDNKIKTFQKKEERRNRSISRKRNPHLKYNDSLSKKKGKQVLSKIPSITERWKHSFEPQTQNKNNAENDLPVANNSSLVARWKDYWNEKVEKTLSSVHGKNITYLQLSDACTYLDNINDSCESRRTHINENLSNRLDDTVIENKEILNDKHSAFLEMSKTREDLFYASAFSNNKNDSELIDFKVFGEKYQPTPINLTSLTQRIDRFLDTVSNPSPAIDTDSSRFSTPESPFGGIVSKRIIINDNNNNTEKNMKDNILIVEQNGDKLTVKLNENTSEKRIKVLQQISNCSTPDLQNTQIKQTLGNDCRIQETINKPNRLQTNLNKEEIRNHDSLKQIYVSEESHIFEEKILLTNNLIKFPAIAKLKDKIENQNDKDIQETRENFLKQKSKTIDIPKQENFDYLKRYFSLDKIDSSNIHDALYESQVNRNGYISDIYSSCENSMDHNVNISTSTDSIPSLAERKARIEKHLQRLQNKLGNNNQLESRKVDHHKSEYSIYQKVETVESKYKNKSMETLNSANGKAENEIEVFKPIRAIVAVFENKMYDTDNKCLFKQINKNYTKIARRDFKENHVSSLDVEKKISIWDLDAEKREGTMENSEQGPSAVAEHLMKEHVVFKTRINPRRTSEMIEKNDIKKNATILSDEKIIIEVKNLTEELQQEDEEYKERFLEAKRFFQTLDEKHKGNVCKKKRKLNECEKLLFRWENETKEKDNEKNEDVKLDLDNIGEEIHGIVNTILQNDKNCTKPQSKPGRKIPRKAFSAPTSDTETENRKRAWNKNGSGRLKKISEKFQVEGLFNDIVGDTRRTRLGSFKGIPHKNAVLAAFRSMENISQQSSYEYTVSQMEDFAKKNGIINAQTYHSDFPYLPTTEPGKYRARCDTAASGLIMRKDLLKEKKERRNSAPVGREMRLDLITNI